MYCAVKHFPRLQWPSGFIIYTMNEKGQLKHDEEFEGLKQKREQLTGGGQIQLLYYQGEHITCRLNANISLVTLVGQQNILIELSPHIHRSTSVLSVLTLRILRGSCSSPPWYPPVCVVPVFAVSFSHSTRTTPIFSPCRGRRTLKG